MIIDTNEHLRRRHAIQLVALRRTANKTFKYADRKAYFDLKRRIQQENTY